MDVVKNKLTDLRNKTNAKMQEINKVKEHHEKWKKIYEAQSEKEMKKVDFEFD